jgi:hypothetical protein
MADKGESINPSLAEIKTQPNRQESLIQQKETLNPNNKEHQVLSEALDNIYLNYKIVDKEALKIENVRYQPACANINTLNKDRILGEYYGVYEYIPIVEAINNIPDPYNIFPKIESIINQSHSKDNDQIIKDIAEIIKENTNIPVLIEKFNGSNGGYGRLENGNLYDRPSQYMKENYGIHTSQFKCSDESWSKTQDKGYPPEEVDLKNPVGDVLLINELKLDDPAVLKTCLHELGHVIEENFVLPTKEKELGDKKYFSSEVISSLYGIKAGLIMAQYDKDKAVEMIIPQLEVYNWVLTGTTAP